MILILQNLILRTRLCGVGFITQCSWIFHFHLTTLVMWKCFVAPDRSGLQEETKFATPWASSCPAATRYNLTPQYSIPTTVSLAVVKKIIVRAGLAIPRRLQQEQPCSLFGSGCYLDLAYKVVATKQVLNTGDTHRARQHVCPAGSPGTAGRFAGVRSCDAAVLWFTCLALYDVSCSVGLLYKTYATSPTQPISFATVVQRLGVSSSFFPQFLCELRTSRPSGLFLPFLPRESTPDPRNRNLAPTPDPRALGWEVQHAGVPVSIEGASAGGQP